MTQQKQNQITNWLLGLLTMLVSGSFVFAWNTWAMLSVLKDHDLQHTAAESKLFQKTDDAQLERYDINTRLTHLEDKIKPH